MGLGYDSGGEGSGAVIHQPVDEGVLSAKDERDQGFGVEVKLEEGVDL